MDPIANVEEQKRIAERLLHASDMDQPLAETDALRLAELVLALDEWRKKGGSDPYAK